MTPKTAPSKYQSSRTGNNCLVLKLGGELLEKPADVTRIARGVARLSQKSHVVLVHGGGKEIDYGLKRAGIQKLQVDGLRITDARTLEVVVAVLSGTINTRLVAAVKKAGAKPVGLTGADADVATLKRAAAHKTTRGKLVKLGFVGVPVKNSTSTLLTSLLAEGYTPIVACIGTSQSGQLLNVNADTLAAHLAITLKARRLIIAGSTEGVLDDDGQTIGQINCREAARLIRLGTVKAGMVAKLQACRTALDGGVPESLIVNGYKEKIERFLATEKGLRKGRSTQVLP